MLFGFALILMLFPKALAKGFSSGGAWDDVIW